MIDAIHHAANMARIRSLAAAKEMLAEALVDREPRFFASLEAVLEVLPVSRSYSGIDLKGEIAAAADDFEVLYKLARLAYGDYIDDPEQLKLWQGRKYLTVLSDHKWKLKYTPDVGDLVRLFYVPALEDAERYDRLTGYFSANALTLASRGIEGLVRNNGQMRLIAGCTLDPPEIDAIEKGEELRDLVERRLADLPLAPPDPASSDALELLAWIIARGHLNVKVAVPCDTNGKPIPMDGIFHEKSGIIEDRGGNKIAWNGSLNETAAGWQHNWESINVYTSWGPDHQRVAQEEANFTRIWSGRARRAIVLDVPDAARQDLMRFMPKDDQPARLKKFEKERAKPRSKPIAKEFPTPVEPNLDDLRSRVWSFIQHAPSLPLGGERVGEATSAVTPWPHQVRAFERLYYNWPPKLLIADEVGLGKTIPGEHVASAGLARRAR